MFTSVGRCMPFAVNHPRMLNEIRSMPQVFDIQHCPYALKVPLHSSPYRPARHLSYSLL